MNSLRVVMGLHQGDPISPNLFTLVMEVLLWILFRCSLKPEFKFFWRCKPTSLSHLFFADDVFLFLEVDLPTIALLKEGIQTLGVACSQIQIRVKYSLLEARHP